MSSSKINVTEKTGFIVFGIIGLLFLVVGVININARLRAPFIQKDTAGSVVQANADVSIEALKQRDTDHDGLSDYDEIYVYGTSPYIADTDSDGIPDGQEVKNGTDPNCPQGKTCLVEQSPATLNAPVPPAQAAPDAGNIDLTQTLPGAAAAAAAPPTAQALRDALKQQGVDQATLDKIDDASLLKLYADTAAQTPPPTP